MSKHINTHLFFHMNDSSSSKQNKESSSTSTSTKPKKLPSSLISGYEIDTNPPLPSESGDYYDYYTNYGIPDYFGPLSPATSPPYAHYNNEYPYYWNDRNIDYDFYSQPEGTNVTNYREGTFENTNNAAYGVGNSYDNYSNNISGHSGQGPSTLGYYSQHANNNNSSYLQAPMLSPPIQDPKRASNSLLPSGDVWSNSYRNDHRGLSAFAHKLHRITFVEACIFQPPDLPSPVRASGTTAPIHQHSSAAAGPSSSMHPRAPAPPPVLAQGERSPTSTGGTQYYQEWTSKHMRHLCSRFEKPDQQQLLMNVERKSKYPFIILCTPEHASSLSKSSSCSSTKVPVRHHYHREISQHSAYSLDEEDEEEDEDHEHWITQKQRDSVNHHYLPPPPPPLLMPHIWPEIRYIDGLYTVCASIVRPGSGVPCEFDEYLYSDMNLTFDQTNYVAGRNQDDSFKNHHQEKHISFQDSPPVNQDTGSAKHPLSRPAGYIVSAFATFPGEDSDRLEKNWLFWTGARILYKYLPTCVGLRRLIFLKRCPDMYREDLINQQSKIKPTIFTGFTYVLLCECFNLKESYIASVCTTIDQLRARCCGYSALYLTHFQQQQQQQSHIQSHVAQQQSLHHQTSVSSASHHIHHHHQHQQQQQQQTQHHHHHHIPRHHRSTSDFSEFDADLQ